MPAAADQHEVAGVTQHLDTLRGLMFEVRQRAATAVGPLSAIMQAQLTALLAAEQSMHQEYEYRCRPVLEGLQHQPDVGELE